MKVLALLGLIFIVSCLEKKPGTSILTTGIYNLATFSINDQDASGMTIDLGEHLLTEDPIQATVRVYNGTEYPYTELSLDFLPNGEYSSSTNYLPTEDGAFAFPGLGGTCPISGILAPKTSCTIIIQINPREERQFNEIVKLSYKQFVELEEHQATISFLAGMPAALAFTNDQTQYSFGVPAGPSSNPVVERADDRVYEETITIKNVGGLSAQNINLTFPEFCASTLTSVCPPGMLGAYRMEHNCPTTLAPQETCDATVYYLPLNKNPESGSPPDDILEINYRGTLTATYQTDSTGRTAALNAYFNSFSTDIQAEFATTNKIISFDQEVISGNRESRFITIRNVGYRSGYLNSISIHDQSDVLIADCYRQDGSQFLNCVDTSLNPVPLSTLPFTVRDVHSCLSSPTSPVEIQVEQSCRFDIFFQPSVTFLTPKPSEFLGLNVHATYDALWKNETRIIKTRLSLLSAKSISAAQIVVDRIIYDGEEVYKYEDGLPSFGDLKKLPLQAEGFTVAKNILITFKNIGETRATSISLKDGSNRPIPIGGTNVQLGAKSPYYYTNVITSATNCTVIEPTGQCSISMNFTPVGMPGGAAEEDLNMFDSVDSLLRKIKSFILSYNSGALYTDANIDGPPDYPLQNSEAQITAELLRKGLLMELADDSRNITNFSGASANDEVYTYLYLRNIGTGSLSYIQALNPPGPNAQYQSQTWSLVPTSDPQSLGADYDCLDIVDTNLTSPTNPTVDPSTRTGLFQELETTKSCVYTVRIKAPATDRHKNANTCSSTTLASDEAQRLYVKDLSNTNELWELCKNRTNKRWPNIRFRYFDGDQEDATPDHPDFGNSYITKAHELNFNGAWSRKLNFYHYTPFLTATVYRHSFILPDLMTGEPDQSQQVIPEAWFHGPASLYYTSEHQASISAYPFSRGGFSRTFAQTLNFWNLRDDYDYIYYLGSFPKGSGNVDFAPNMKNDGSHSLVIRAYSSVSVDSSGSEISGTGGPITRLTSITPNPNRTVNSGGGFNITHRLNTANAGEFARKVTITMDTGEHDGPVHFYQSNTPQTPLPPKKQRTIKYLMVANVLDDGEYPKLSAQVREYEVTTNAGGPPTETPLPLVGSSLSWNYTAPSSSILFESVKIPGTPKSTDPYAKKSIILTNDSTHPISNFNFRFRTSTTSYLPSNPPGTFAHLAAESTCAVGMTLAPGASCTLTYRYRPTLSDTTRDLTLTFVFSSARKEYFMQNVGISLAPKSPGKLIAVGKTLQTINYQPKTGSMIVRDSYRLQFPDVQLTSIPTEINFNAESGTYSKIELQNQEETKVSLLLAYQRYLAANELRGYSSSNQPLSSVVPLEEEYTPIQADGLQYANIFLNKYDNGDERLRVEASRGCFFGDDEGSSVVPLHQQGFNNSTSMSNPCYLRFYLKVNFDYLNKEITNIDAEAMADNAFEMWYYSVNRSSTDYTWFHLTGTVLPNSSSASGVYDNVQAFDNRTINFSTPTFTPTTPALGAVTGIRVYMSNNKSNLNNLYRAPTEDYFDIRFPTDDNWFANFSSGLQNGHYYYFRPVAIRKDTRFNHTAERFPGLLSGEYISIASLPILEVVVPPLNHYYLHDLKAIVNKNIQGPIGSFTWTESASTCSAAKQILRTPTNVTKSYELIDYEVWEEIKNVPTAHSYSNHLSISHWLSNPAVVIDTYLAGVPGFDSSASQFLESERIFYMKDPGNANAPVRFMVGGVPATGYSDYTSLIPPHIPFGNARCMISLE